MGVEDSSLKSEAAPVCIIDGPKSERHYAAEFWQFGHNKCLGFTQGG
jgi:hypothetical protein